MEKLFIEGEENEETKNQKNENRNQEQKPPRPQFQQMQVCQTSETIRQHKPYICEVLPRKKGRWAKMRCEDDFFFSERISLPRKS